MKKDQVQIGQTYNAKITDKVVPVRIDAEHKSGGWHGTNMTTNRKVHIKSAQKLRNKIAPGKATETEKPAKRQPVKKKLSAAERKTMLAKHKADQENVRQRDERKASPKGTTTSEEAMPSSAGKKRTKKKTTDASAKNKKLSLVAAAAQVLAKKNEPMTTKEMVDKVTAAGLWTPGAGKTPHATLYSAILRDMKSKTPRFQKVDRGHFTLAKGA